MEYKHTEDMGEISGFGDSYEDGCQRMLDAGVKWILANPEASPSFKGIRGVMGLCIENNADAEALSDAIVEPVREEGPTGAMVEAVIQRCLFIKEHGWARYCEELREAG